MLPGSWCQPSPLCPKLRRKMSKSVEPPSDKWVVSKDSATKIPLQGARKESLPGLCSFVWVSWVGLLGKALTFNAFFLNSRHEKYGFVAEHFLIFHMHTLASQFIASSMWTIFILDKEQVEHVMDEFQIHDGRPQANSWIELPCEPCRWRWDSEGRKVSCCQWNQKASHGHTRKCPIPIFRDRFLSSPCSCGMEITAKSSRVTPLNQLQSLLKLPFCTEKVLKVCAEWQ